MKKLILIIFLISCNKLKKLNFKNIYKGEISSVLTKQFKEGDSRLYEQLNELDFNKLKGFYGEENRNLLMLTLCSSLPEKEKEKLFLKLLLLIGVLDGKIDFKLFFAILLNTEINFLNPFDNSREESIKRAKIFDPSKEINIKELSSVVAKSFKNDTFLINSKDIKGKSLPFYVIDSGIESLIEIFLQLPNIKFCKFEGLNLLQYALLKKPIVVEYLRTKDSIRENLMESFLNDDSLPSPLVCAIDSPELVKQLIMLGADSNSTDEFENKAILIAANFGNEEVINVLLASGGKYLTPRKLINRKLKKFSSMAAATLSQLGLDALFKGLGAPISPNVLGLVGNLKNKHTIQRTECYEKIYEVFVKGKWLNYDIKSSPHHIKNLLKLINFSLSI